MGIQKAHWLSEGDNIHVNVPIAKIDEERRLVSGFASLNNVDQHDEVVTAEASLDAFNSFRGNIREMHQPIAAGRMLSFSQETYYDQNTLEPYEGIYVTVYVSKGAPDTWEKVIDGTLAGFSIGGFITDSHTEYLADLGKSIRFITGLTLFELSLVDNPANQLANVLSIQKSDTGEMVAKGLAVDVETQNVFWCDTDSLAKATPDDSASCGSCSGDMSNIGWIEVTDAATTPSELKKFVDNYCSEKVITAQQIKEQTSETVQQNSEFANEENNGDNITDNVEKSEGGVNVSDVETVEKAEEVSEVVETTDEVVEKAADEAVEETPEAVEKSEGVVEETVVETVEKEATEVAPDIEALTKQVSEMATAFAGVVESISTIAKALETLTPVTDKVDEVIEATKTVSTRVENLEKATAKKKSGNDEESEPVTKAFSWDGRFAGVSSIVG